jgi:hypothetical protein
MNDNVDAPIPNAYEALLSEHIGIIQDSVERIWPIIGELGGNLEISFNGILVLINEERRNGDRAG